MLILRGGLFIYSNFVAHREVTYMTECASAAVFVVWDLLKHLSNRQTYYPQFSLFSVISKSERVNFKPVSKSPTRLLFGDYLQI